MADHRTLLFAVTATGPATGNPFSGALSKLPVLSDGRPGELDLFWRSRPLDGPDGIAIARSGNVYVALAGASQILLLSPAGDELARAPANPLANLRLEGPVDAPGSAAFLGNTLLVSNHSGIRGDPRSWAVLDVYAGEPGLSLHYPFTGAKRLRLRPKIRLRVRPRRVRSGTRRRFRFKATARRGGKRRAVRGARVRFAGRRKRTNRRGRVTFVVRLRKTGRRRAVAKKRGHRPGRTAVRVVPAG